MYLRRGTTQTLSKHNTKKMILFAPGIDAPIERQGFDIKHMYFLCSHHLIYPYFFIISYPHFAPLSSPLDDDEIVDN